MDDRQQRKRLRAEAVAEYKDLTRELKSVCKDDDAVKIQEFIRFNLDRSSSLYPIVKKKLEGTVADSRHIKELMDLGHDAAKRINAAKPFEMRGIIRNVMRNVDETEGRKLSRQEFSRYIAEKHVTTFLMASPTFEFFYGTLKSEDLTIKKKERRPREKLVEKEAVTAKERNIDKDVEEDSTPREVEHIDRVMTRVITRNRKPEAPFFETLVDPHSFTQTVENIFHVSFLVKEGKYGVKPDRSKGAVITIEDPKEDNEAKQSILSFTMEDYKEWITKFDISQCPLASSSSHAS